MAKFKNLKVQLFHKIFFFKLSSASKFRGLEVPPADELRLIDGVHRRWILPDPYTFYIWDHGKEIQNQYREEISKVG